MPSALSDTPASMSRISTGSPAPSVHSATAVELPDGTIRAFWFVVLARGPATSQSGRRTAPAGPGAPRGCVDRDLVARGTRRYVRKLAIPSPMSPRTGAASVRRERVLRWLERERGQSPGLWSRRFGRVVNRLIASPVLNLGTLVRAPPCPIRAAGFSCRPTTRR